FPFLCRMNREELVDLIFRKRSYLCVGLDTDPQKLPTHFPRTADGMLEFNKKIIDATREYAVAYKVNTAFLRGNGPRWLAGDGCYGSLYRLRTFYYCRCQTR
ncbi:MAG: hypothetical protein NVV59_11535, partial [Chitinophagaceae bacterium]|nr:hypothetical protein [Chitinophagaceae bacterium]